jgi:hypothetical protein
VRLRRPSPCEGWHLFTRYTWVHTVYTGTQYRKTPIFMGPIWTEMEKFMEDSNNNQHVSDNIGDDTSTIAEENSVGSQVEVPDNPVFSAPLKRNERGQFTKGTGSRGYLGGRPKGAKDKLSVQFLEVMQSVIEEKGTEMMMRLAEENPAAALAIISRSLPQRAMQEAIDGVTDEAKDAIQQVTINLVSSDSPRLSDTRSDEEIETRQRGLDAPQTRLTAPISRIEPSPDDLDRVVNKSPENPPEVTPTVDARDEEAARAERERQAKLRASIKAHGGLTGRAPRSAASDELEYRDNEDWI